MTVSEHVAEDRLVAWVAGALRREEGEVIERHVTGCERCRVEAESWRAVAVAMRASAAARPAPGPELMAQVLRRIDAEPARPRNGDALRRAWSILVGQRPLVQRELWAASALVMVLGVVVVVSSKVAATGVLGLLAPLVAALGVSMIYGPEVDPALEVTLATPTSARAVMLARLTLVTAYDLALALVASSVLAAVGAAPTLGGLVGSWLGPMLLLSTLSLLLSVWSRPAVGIAVALGLWSVRVLADVHGMFAFVNANVVDAVWSTSAATLLAAAVCLALAAAVTGTRERLA